VFLVIHFGYTSCPALRTSKVCNSMKGTGVWSFPATPSRYTVRGAGQRRLRNFVQLIIKFRRIKAGMNESSGTPRLTRYLEYYGIVWKIPPKWYAVVGIRGRERINTAVLRNVWNVDLCSLYQA
jgi:hypothetical protein